MSWRYWLIDKHILVDGRCPIEHTGWSQSAPTTQPRITFVRSGVYLRRVNGVESYADSTTMLVTHPGDELEVAHPLGCGDMFTFVDVCDGSPARGEFRLDDAVDMHHRGLVAAARRGTDQLELAERVALLIDALPNDSNRHDRWSPETDRAHRKLAQGAAEVVLGSGYDVGLDGIASRLNCSPHHLSRVFGRVMGMSLTDYRNRIRVRAVLADLQDGDENLRELAARYGFADQAHMIRVVRRHCGDAPGRLRRMLRTEHKSTTSR